MRKQIEDDFYSSRIFPCQKMPQEWHGKEVITFLLPNGEFEDRPNPHFRPLYDEVEDKLNRPNIRLANEFSEPEQEYLEVQRQAQIEAQKQAIQRAGGQPVPLVNAAGEITGYVDGASKVQEMSHRVSSVKTTQASVAKTLP